MLGQFALAAGGFILGCLFCLKFGARVTALVLGKLLEEGYLIKTRH